MPLLCSFMTFVRMGSLEPPVVAGLEWAVDFAVITDMPRFCSYHRHASDLHKPRFCSYHKDASDFRKPRFCSRLDLRASSKAVEGGAVGGTLMVLMC